MKKVLIINCSSWGNLRQTINGSGVSDDGRYRFFINEMEGTPDFVVVKSRGLEQAAIFDVPKHRTILATGEPYGIKAYPKSYREQFGTVLSCQPEIVAAAKSDTSVCYGPPVLPWFVGLEPQKGGSVRVTMTREDIAAATPQKRKLLSVITSKKAFTKGHVDRLRFVKKLQAYYGDEVDVFGQGFRPFGDKWEVLAPYKYHIVIENSDCDYYWTEKLADCFLAGAYPLYHGCANITDYFSEEALTKIDIRNFEQVVQVIEQARQSNLFEHRQAALQEAKELVLGPYNMFNMIAKACDAIAEGRAEGQTLLKPASSFFSWHNLYLHAIDWNFHKLVARWLA